MERLQTHYTSKAMYGRVNRDQFKQNAKDAVSTCSVCWDISEAEDELKKVVPQEKCEQIVLKCSQCITTREKILTLVMLLLETEPFVIILSVLDCVGLETIADQICRPLDRQVSRTELPHSRHLQTFYFHLKQNIDNNNFIDRGEYLQSLFNSLKRSFPRFRNVNDLSKAACRFAVVTWLRIQFCRRDTHLIRTVLCDMWNSWPRGVDKDLCEIFFHSKMAIADTMDGMIDPAIEKCRTAKHLSASFHDPLIKALTSHDGRYTYQRVFELNRSEKYRKQIRLESENGLDFLSSDYNGCDLFNRIMKRMFLLYLAQNRLKIQNDLDTEGNDIISDIDLKTAKNALAAFDNTLRPDEDIYLRIERIYMLHKARLHISQGEFQNSEDTLQHMQELDSQGNMVREGGTCITDDMAQLAQKFLPETVIDPRRGMIYMVCRARICERDHKYGMAEFLLSRAFELAQNGAIYTNEMANIRKFSSRLLTRSNGDLTLGLRLWSFYLRLSIVNLNLSQYCPPVHLQSFLEYV